MTLTEASAIPYATLGVSVGGGPEQIVLLATDAHDERLWTSGTRFAVTTRHGRVVATAGLDKNLTAISNPSFDIGNWASPRRVSWNADFADVGVYGVPVECNDAPAGEERITILGAELDTVRVMESCECPTLNWSFQNTYWVGPASNRVWRSIQHIHPRAGSIEIELLRPPQSPE
ncbi:MAG: YjbF family lipoprotein [Reyranella sp.]|nr:YjbF family lipoprotein [Reyranella sp.]